MVRAIARTATLLPLLAASATIACGASRTPTAAPASSSSAAVPASDGGAAPDATAPRAFAKTALDAQGLIQDQIETQTQTLWKCVDDYRTGQGDPHRAVTIEVGIDEQGKLLGVTSADPKQRTLDPKLKDCLWNALRDLPFPRSHAGVITLRQSFTDTSIQR